MKKMMFTLMAVMLAAVNANAMSYEQARNEALFLTDKMAYELNLTDAQYEAAYEINLDYLMGVTSEYDVYGPYWERRNLDLSYILFSWQWDLFRAATYFYRPLYWSAGYWHFGIYARYPHRDYFYFGRPHFYTTYRGGHSWRMNGGRSYYEGRHNYYRPEGRTRDNHIGMRNGWDRGDYRGDRGGHHSSTYITGDRRDNNRGSFGDGHRNNGGGRNNGGSFGDGQRNNGGGHNNGGSFGDGQRNNGGGHNNGGSFGDGQRHNGGGNNNGGSFGDGQRNNGGNNGGGSIGGGNRNGGGNYGGGSIGGGNRNGGGSSHGGGSIGGGSRSGGGSSHGGGSIGGGSRSGGGSSHGGGSIGGGSRSGGGSSHGGGSIGAGSRSGGGSSHGGGGRSGRR